MRADSGPSGSFATAWNHTSSGAAPEVTSASASTITGGCCPPAVTTTSTVSVPTLPSASVTSTVTVLVPAVVNVVVTLEPNAVPPPGNVHLYVRPPAFGTPTSAVKFTWSGAVPDVGSANAVTSSVPASSPQSASSTTPAETRRPPRRCWRYGASEKDAAV